MGLSFWAFQHETAELQSELDMAGQLLRQKEHALKQLAAQTPVCPEALLKEDALARKEFELSQLEKKLTQRELNFESRPQEVQTELLVLLAVAKPSHEAYDFSKHDFVDCFFLEKRYVDGVPTKFYEVIYRSRDDPEQLFRCEMDKHDLLNLKIDEIVIEDDNGNAIHQIQTIESMENGKKIRKDIKYGLVGGAGMIAASSIYKALMSQPDLTVGVADTDGEIMGFNLSTHTYAEHKWSFIMSILFFMFFAMVLVSSVFCIKHCCDRCKINKKNTTIIVQQA